MRRQEVRPAVGKTYLLRDGRTVEVAALFGRGRNRAVQFRGDAIIYRYRWFMQHVEGAGDGGGQA